MFTPHEAEQIQKDAAFGIRALVRSLTFFPGPISDDTRDSEGKQNGFTLIYNANQKIEGTAHFVTKDTALTTVPANILPSSVDVLITPDEQLELELLCKCFNM